MRTTGDIFTAMAARGATWLAVGAPAFTAVSAAGQEGGDAGWYPVVHAEIGASTPRRRPETGPANEARRCLKAGLLASGTDQQGIVG